jgi:hypothetical protein
MVFYFLISECSYSNQANIREPLKLDLVVKSNIKANDVTINYLKSKLLSVISRSNALASTNSNSRFAALFEISELDSENISESSLFYSSYEVFLRIIDVYDGKVFISNSYRIKGVGNSKEKSISDAFKNIEIRQGGIINDINKSISAIEEYYENNCTKIISEADLLISQKKYDEAIFKITSIPSFANKCSDFVNKKIIDFFNLKTKSECEKLISFTKICISNNRFDDAYAILYSISNNEVCSSKVTSLLAEVENKKCEYNMGKAHGFFSSQNLDSASIYLSSIPYNSKCATDARKLISEIKTWAKEKLNKEFEISLLIENNKFDLQKLTIDAARAIGVSYLQQNRYIIFN